MTRRLSTVTLAIGVALSMVPSAGSAAAGDLAHDRVYLLADDGDYLYWSVDPTDPELGVGTVTRSCGATNVWGIPGESKPCLQGSSLDGTNTFNLYSFPAALFSENVTWNAANPLRFHLEGWVNTGGVPYSMHLVLQKGTTLVESPPATQTAPGVWDGQITSGSPLSSGTVNFFGIRVTTQAPAATIELRTGGRSYVQLPRAFAGRGVPQMMREDVYRPEPSSYVSTTRTFSFNDANWSAYTFTGRTGPAKDFEVSLDRNAPMLMAWVELYDTPFVHDVHRGRPADIRKLTHGASVHLLRGGQLLEHSGYGSGQGGWGVEVVAVPDVAAGPLTVRVQSSGGTSDDSLPYTVHVLVVGGERTIRSMRSRFVLQEAARAVSVGVCPGSPELVPATSAVRSIGLDLDWDTESLGLSEWTPRFSLPEVGEFPCSEGGTGDRVRLTVPGKRIWYVGPTPAYDSTTVSAYDTVFEISARYTYSAPPAP